MNLQLCMPYEKCPFHCPMCIASNNKNFNNLYAKNKTLYFERLKKALKKTTGDVILTGDTEPTLNKEWLTEVIDFIKSCGKHNIEIQTHNYLIDETFKMLDKIDVVAYSITSPRELEKMKDLHKYKGITRLVILGTKANIKKLKENPQLIPSNVEQITIKMLQHGEDEKTNKIVDLIKANLTEIVKIEMPQNISYRIDTNCQESENRYRVFRENGIRYKGW